MHLLYLHGFRSSPASFKAQRLASWIQAHRPEVRWWCPQLPPSPADAWTLIRQGMADWPLDQTVGVGSSLGGFYATAVAEATGCRALLLNPAIDPARDLAAHIGEQTQFHTPEETFYFRPEY
ncbi:MAG: esterase, partial [Burkholderiales bacterium PBB5]